MLGTFCISKIHVKERGVFLSKPILSLWQSLGLSGSRWDPVWPSLLLCCRVRLFGDQIGPEAEALADSACGICSYESEEHVDSPQELPLSLRPPGTRSEQGQSSLCFTWPSWLVTAALSAPVGRPSPGASLKKGALSP